MERRLSCFAQGRLVMVRPGALCLLGIFLPLTALGATFTVNTVDDRDDGQCNAQHCSLREAIKATNAPGSDAVHFNIPNCGGVCTIVPQSPLPPITDNGTTIDGTTQTQNQGDTNPHGPEMEIQGHANAILNGEMALVLKSRGNVVRGLVVNFWEAGIAIDPPQAAAIESATTTGGNKISENYIGTDPTGRAPRGNVIGILVQDQIDGTALPGNEIYRNLVAANSTGITIRKDDTNGNKVYKNRVGAHDASAKDMQNLDCGISVTDGAGQNAIGPENVVSGNGNGVCISRPFARRNRIFENRIGTDEAGTLPIPNVVGVKVFDRASENEIRNNLIAGNRTGVLLSDTWKNNLFDNTIGITPIGIHSSPQNGEVGIAIWRGEENAVGTAQNPGNNIISGNGKHGIRVESSPATTIFGNKVGTDPGGTNAVPNGSGPFDSAIVVTGSSAQTRIVGNTVSGNKGPGVELANGADWVLLEGNKIGINQAGNPLANQAEGIVVQNAGTNAGRRSNAITNNTISANMGHGIYVEGPQADGTRILRNRIGTNENGQLVTGFGNGKCGVSISAAMHSDIRYNTIAANQAQGIRIEGATSLGHWISKNSMYENGGIGIDLLPGEGHTVNDAGDVDQGANGVLNYPELRLTRVGNDVLVDGTAIATTPAGAGVIASTVEIFMSDGSSLPLGEGKDFLLEVQVDQQGVFQARLPGLVAGTHLTATASYNMNTSEFAPSVRVP